MARERRELRLGDVAQIKHGFAFEGAYFVDEPSNDVLVTPGNFEVGGGFKFGKLKYYRGPVPHEYVLAAGDVVVTMTDLSKASDTLGYSALVPRRSNLRFLHNQRIGKLEVTRPDLVDKEFLHWLLRTPEYRAEILASSTGTGVKHTAPVRIHAFCFAPPSLLKQRAIAGVLGALDDKIELNRRMNVTLEAMARALFQSWFIDFDPVRAKAEGHAPLGMDAATAKLFPNELVESQLGPIPKGWTVVPLHTMSSHLSRGIGPVYLEVGGVCVLNQKCIRDHRLDVTKARRHDASKKSVDGRLIQRLDVLVNSTGVGTLGRVAQVWNLAEDMIVDSHVTVVRAANNVNPWFLGVGMLEREAEIEALGEGSTGQTELSRVRLGALPWLRPPEALQHQFGDTVAARLQRIVTSDRESQTLTRIRDELLPRLLSGEMSVADGQQAEATS